MLNSMRYRPGPRFIAPFICILIPLAQHCGHERQSEDSIEAQVAGLATAVETKPINLDCLTGETTEECLWRAGVKTPECAAAAYDEIARLCGKTKGGLANDWQDLCGSTKKTRKCISNLTGSIVDKKVTLVSIGAAVAAERAYPTFSTQLKKLGIPIENLPAYASAGKSDKGRTIAVVATIVAKYAPEKRPPPKPDPDVINSCPAGHAIGLTLGPLEIEKISVDYPMCTKCQDVGPSSSFGSSQVSAGPFLNSRNNSISINLEGGSDQCPIISASQIRVKLRSLNGFLRSKAKGPLGEVDIESKLTGTISTGVKYTVPGGVISNCKIPPTFTFPPGSSATITASASGGAEPKSTVLVGVDIVGTGVLAGVGVGSQAIDIAAREITLDVSGHTIESANAEIEKQIDPLHQLVRSEAEEVLGSYVYLIDAIVECSGIPKPGPLTTGACTCQGSCYAKGVRPFGFCANNYDTIFGGELIFSPPATTYEACVKTRIFAPRPGSDAQHQCSRLKYPTMWDPFWWVAGCYFTGWESKGESCTWQDGIRKCVVTASGEKCTLAIPGK